MRMFQVDRTRTWVFAACVLVVFGVALVGPSACEASTIFSDDFEAGFSGYTTTGNVNWNGPGVPPANGNYAIRIRQVGTVSRTISTVGYTSINVSFYLAATVNVGGEYVNAAWYDGTTWTVLHQINNGDPEEDSQLHLFTYALPAGAQNNAAFALRFTLVGSSMNDRGYIDDIVVTGKPTNPVLSLSGTNGQVRVNGTLRALPHSESFAADSVVSLEAVPDSGYGFTGWSGDMGGGTNPDFITMDDHKSVIANFAVHTLTATASAAPSTVASGGTSNLTGGYTDSIGHGIATWAWDDDGAGGTFSPSADVQSPSYTAPENLSDDDLPVALTVFAECDGPEPMSDDDTQILTVQPVLHTLVVTASAAPGAVLSGGSTSLFATATDSRAGHSIATWSWSDGGAGGSFAPSDDVQNPVYTAPANLTDDNLPVTLTVTATCDGPSPLTESAAAGIIVYPIAHSFSVSADATPTVVASGGTSTLSAGAIDSRAGHSVVWWAWNDGGAGGAFSPSTDVQNPSYTAPENLTDDDLPVTLTVSAECDGPSPLGDDDAKVLTVQPVLHTLIVTATAAPAAVISGGSTNLTATATDSRAGHSATWSWSDGGAGGSFAPSGDVQNPVYNAPANLTDDNVSVTLTLTATCDGPDPLTESDSCNLIVTPIAHSLAAGASCVPSTVASGGTTSLTGTAVDSRIGHSLVSWSWDDGGAGGGFSPSASVQNPSYTAPANTGDSDLTVTLTVTATCDGPSPLSDSDSTTLTVNPVTHTLTASASCLPSTVASGATTSLTGGFTDSRPGHSIATWAWGDGGVGGSFSPSASVQNPSYTAPANTTDDPVTVTLTVTATCNGLSPLSDSDSVGLTVNPANHSLTVNASCVPSTVPSGGTTSLTATATDSRSGHSVATWSWSDAGAGGSFSPSASAQNPSYTAAANTTDSNRTVTLTVTATCNGSSPVSNSDAATLTVQPAAHSLSVSASCSPSTVPSGGTTSLTATATDSRSGHSVATWSWSDGGAGGSFSPSASVQNPSYTAAANTSGSDRTVTLAVTATCNGPSPLTRSGSTTLTVQSVAHTFSVSASCDPDAVDSGGVTSLDASATDSQGHSVTWLWTDNGAGGTFSPSATVPNPTYTAPENTSPDDLIVTLTATGTCDGPDPLHDDDSVLLTVRSATVGTCLLTGSSYPTQLEWGGSGSVSLAYQNLDPFTWGAADGYQLRTWAGMDRWNPGSSPVSVPLTSAVPPGDTCSFSFTIVAPPLTTLSYPLPVTQTTPGALDGLDCAWQFSRGSSGLTGGAASQDVVITRFADIQPGTDGAWARFYTEECAGRVPPIVGGYDDGTYRPTVPVDRATMAVYMARALKLDLTTYQGSFSDVSSDFWAVLYIEALVRTNIVKGYDDGTYRSAYLVGRDAMAVYVSRGLAGGDQNVPDGPVTPSFPDVLATHWAYKYIEYARTRSVVSGYSDGTYRPSVAVTRDQMSVYVYRGFIQPVGSAVVLGGPDVTAVDLAEAPGFGWASRSNGPASDPGYGYLVLDAVRLGTDLVYPQTPSGTCEVVFELRLASDPNTPAPGDYAATVALPAADLAAAHDAAVASGSPYFAVYWDIPEGLGPGDYVLVVSIEDNAGVMRQVARRPAFTVTP